MVDRDAVKSDLISAKKEIEEILSKYDVLIEGFAGEALVFKYYGERSFECAKEFLDSPHQIPIIIEEE